jgi:hypothetical protein
MDLAPSPAPNSQEEVKVSQGKSRLSVKERPAPPLSPAFPAWALGGSGSRPSSAAPPFLLVLYVLFVLFVSVLLRLFHGPPTPQKPSKTPAIADICDPLPLLARGGFVTALPCLRQFAPAPAKNAIPPLDFPREPFTLHLWMVRPILDQCPLPRTRGGRLIGSAT